MSSPEGFFFSHQEIATDLIKKKGIHEGRWKLTLGVGLVATSLNAQQPDGATSLLPAGIVLIQSIGITKTDDVNNLTVDAAEVNPAPRLRKREGGHRGKKMVRKN